MHIEQKSGCFPNGQKLMQKLTETEEKNMHFETEMSLQVTSVVFLFGWITNFMFFCGVSRHLYVFSIVLKEIVVKDIINSFMAVFLFTVLAFASALYVLRGPVDSRHTQEINIYEVFASGLTMAEYIEYTIDERGKRQFFRSVDDSLVAIICFTVQLRRRESVSSGLNSISSE